MPVSIFGTKFSDTLVGTAEADFYNGRKGVDAIDYSSETTGVNLSLTAGAGYGGLALGHSYLSIENVIGSGGDDYIIGAAGRSSLWGGDGNDQLFGAGLRMDKLYGGAGADILTANSAGAYMDGGLDDDILIGGTGKDTLVVSLGHDALSGGDGIDTLDLSGLQEGVFLRLNAGQVLDTIFSTDFEVFVGTAVDDIIETARAFSDAVTVRGGNGSDQIWVTAETIGAEAQDGVLYGDAGNDMLGTDTSGKLRAFGGDGHDRLYGGDGRDGLFGGDGRDRLFGGDSRDRLNGGDGADTLNGGNGTDFALYTNADAGVAVDLQTGTGSAGWANGDILISIERVYGSQA